MSQQTRNWFAMFTRRSGSDGNSFLSYELEPEPLGPKTDHLARTIHGVRLSLSGQRFGRREWEAIEARQVTTQQLCIEIAQVKHPIPFAFALDFVREVHWIPNYENGLAEAKWLETKPALLIEPIAVPPNDRIRVYADGGFLDYENVNARVLLVGTVSLPP